MVVLGIILVAAGVVAIVGAVSTADGTVDFFGTHTNAMVIFFVGLAAGLAILWGLGLAKWGTKRSLRHRRESRRLEELSEKLDRHESERRDEEAERGERL